MKLYLPKLPRAKVVVLIPATTPKLEINLVRGDLSFETDRIAGERNINVVSGHVDLLGNADSYTTLHASVLMGSFHDHRYGRDDEHGIVSKSLSGTGKGSIEIRDQMGHSSIQITVDTYGHLIPGANINWVDGLDRKTTSQQTATQAQLNTGERGEHDPLRNSLSTLRILVGPPGFEPGTNRL